MTSTKKEGNGSSLPFLNAYGNITKAFEKLIQASTPERFTHDFLETKLGLKGGSARPIIPFLKRTGFLNADGSPSARYNQFRNPELRPTVAADALRDGYQTLYEINEYVHDLPDTELKGVVVQATGLETGSSSVKGIVGSFKALKEYADFDADQPAEVNEEEDVHEDLPKTKPQKSISSTSLKLGYTINLNLPATSDVAVFDAIFKSLRNHLLDD